MKYEPRIEARREVQRLESDGYKVIDRDSSQIEGFWKMEHANGNRIVVTYDTIPFNHIAIVKNGKIVKFVI